ncbi:MAG: pyridoxal phosphate-dependent aminotransferase [candidate division Zixibacteria bacterium]|nr:pyridoxal phosphate-dependent aminotransferase [candidate division Zixibacteria bacterium]
MPLSHLAEEICDPPTLKLSQKARDLKAQGEAVIHLGSGEPLNKTPQSAIDHCRKLLETGEIRYSPTEGAPTLIQAIIGYTEKNYAKTVDKQNVIVCNGAKHALYTLIMTIINPDEEVIIPAPYWVSYPELVKMAYGQPVIVPCTNDQFFPNMTDISAAVTSKTRAIIINSPNNPSGAIFPDALIKELVDFCAKNDLYLIMDDIYHKLAFDNQTPVSCYSFSNGNPETSKLVVINGVSKLYGMTGFRIGWAVANHRVIAGMSTIAAQTVSCASILTQTAAVGALTGDQAPVESLRLTLQNNRDIMLRELKQLANVKVRVPKGTFYCLPDFSAYEKDSVKLSEYLLEKALVVTIPGKEFGIEGHLRLSYCGSEQDIIEGVARIKWALDTQSPDTIQIGNRTVRRK